MSFFSSAGLLGGLPVVSTDGLEGYWPLNGPTVSGGVALDQSEQQNDITAHGPATTTEGSVFDGMDDYYGALDLGAVSGNAITLSFWIDNTDASNGSESPIGIADDDGGALSYLARDDPDDLVYIGSAGVSISGPDITTDSHVIVKKSSSGFSIKVNGSQHAAGGQSYGNTGNLYLVIGARPTSAGGSSRDYYYSGAMHDVAVYSRHTSNDEDYQLYNAGQ